MAMTSEKIPDYFGAYIGGACRDNWRADGLTSKDLDAMNMSEIKKYVNRNSVWPLPDAIKLVESGLPAFVVFWQRKVRRTSYSHPYVHTDEDVVEKSKRYIDALRSLRKLVEAVKSENDILDFYQHISEISDLKACIRLYDLQDTKFQLNRMRRNCIANNFPYNKKAAAKDRKKAFLPPQLQNIEREGEDFRYGIDVTPEIWQDFFNFRGVEFGNWTSQKDRQASMNFAFDALMDMAQALGIENTDVAFEGMLALAFGSRGRSHASAHYEPEREVINLTKMHGAGCTAHEWFHSMDDRLAKFCGVTDGRLASETKEKSKLPQSFNDLISALKHDADGNATDFYRGSKRFDRHFAKDGFGCWASDCEMAARAFACFVKDTLNCASDYLIAHADVYTFEFDDQDICAIPQGEEREILNELFDQLFYELKEMGFFHERSEQSERKVPGASGVAVEKVFVKGAKTKEELSSSDDFDLSALIAGTEPDSDAASAEKEEEGQVKFFQSANGQMMFFVSIA